MNYFGTNRKVKVDKCAWEGPKVRFDKAELDRERAEYLNKIVTHVKRFDLGDVGSMEPVPTGLKLKFAVVDIVSAALGTRTVKIKGKRGELEAYFGKLDIDG